MSSVKPDTNQESIHLQINELKPSLPSLELNESATNLIESIGIMSISDCNSSVDAKDESFVDHKKMTMEDGYHIVEQDNNNQRDCIDDNESTIVSKPSKTMAPTTSSTTTTTTTATTIAIQLPPIRLPDSDAIKMFVGQIPKNWDESQCRKLFEEYGDIHSLRVLRDKETGNSRGCCFVTFYTRKSALSAQDALHNVRTLPTMHNPIQMKPADNENRQERKIFIGMLSKKYTETDVRNLFVQFGNIEECLVLRDSNGYSRGLILVSNWFNSYCFFI